MEYNTRIAAELGIYLAAFSTLEMGVTFLSAFTLGKNFDMAEAIFGKITNLSTRLDIIEDRAAHSTHTDDTKSSIRLLVSNARGLNTRRNEYVHGTYRVDTATGEVSLLTWLHSTSRKRGAYKVEAGRLKDDTDAVRVFLGSCLSLASPDAELSDLELPPSP